MQSKPLAGVNLGGWLVLEKWITPGLFQGTIAVDEYTFCQQAGAAERSRLTQFRDTFITQQDFEWLAQQGITAVRLPVGYWAFGDAAPYMPTVAYIDKAFEWAAATGIQVLLDLHGAPGSQNGRDHSGQQGKTEWHKDPHNISQTLDTVRKLAERYGKHPALLGISLLNEPHPLVPKTALLEYYKQAYRIIREDCGDKPWIVYSDGYIPARWRKELPVSEFPGTYIDTHHYQVFSPIDKWLSPRLNLLRTRWQLPYAIARMKRHHPVVIGEWSLTLGSRGLRSRNPAQKRKIAQAYARAQLDAYRTAAAWFFWTYRTERGGSWSFRDCVQQGLMPPL